jgi:hypothetical protein
MKTTLKKIIDVLHPGNLWTDGHFYKLSNSIKRNGVEKASIMLMAEMPETKKTYEIEAYVDGYIGFAGEGASPLGGADPDRYVVNGRSVDKTADGKPLSERDNVNRNKYPIHKLSLKRGNIVLHVYTSK